MNNVDNLLSVTATDRYAKVHASLWSTLNEEIVLIAIVAGITDAAALIAIAGANIPVAAIWGETDEVIPLECKDRLSDWNPHAKNFVVGGAGHSVTYTHTPEVLKHVFAPV